MVQDPPVSDYPNPDGASDGASVTTAESEIVPARPEPTRMNPLSLRFGDKALEDRFVRESLRSAMPVIRLFLLSAAILCALFGLLDPFTEPLGYGRFWVIRFGFIVTSLLAALALTYTPLFVRHAQLIMSGGMLCSGGGILLMIALATGPAKETYYAGLILVVIYGSALVRLHHLNALMAATALFAAYQLVAFDINPMPLRTVFSNDFFFAISILVGAFSSFFQEFYIRRNFISRELLVEGKARAERLQEGAEAANKAKGEFLGIISHELRTPLNAIIGFSDIMRQQMFGPLGTERYKTYADDIYDSGNHLLEIINTILDLTKAEADGWASTWPRSTWSARSKAACRCSAKRPSRRRSNSRSCRRRSRCISRPTRASAARSRSISCRTRSSSRRAAAPSPSAFRPTTSGAGAWRSATPASASPRRTWSGSSCRSCRSKAP